VSGSLRSGAVVKPDDVDLSAVIRKRCPRCGLVKRAGEFRPDPRMRSVLGSYCRECRDEYRRAWRAANPERAEAYNAARRMPELRPAQVCIECSIVFTPRRARGPAPLTCSDECRRTRKARLDRERRYQEPLSSGDSSVIQRGGRSGTKSRTRLR